MSKIALIAKLTAADGKADEARKALRGLVAASAEESGLEIYAVGEDANTPGIFWFYELYTDADALGVHGKSDGMKAAMGAVGGCLGAPPEIHQITPVAAKGIDA